VRQIDVLPLSVQLSSIFGLDIIPSEVTMDGGRWAAVRPLVPLEPSGFSIVLSRTPRLVSALFHPDRFALPLIRTMADADAEGISLCIQQMLAARGDGDVVSLMVDEVPVSSEIDLLSQWKSIDIECSSRLISPIGSAEDKTTRVARTCLGMALALLPVGQESHAESLGMPEGATSVAHVNRYERSAVNRAMCISHLGTRCAACGMDFEKSYGTLGKGFIEVHHVTPISQMGGSYLINPLRDLVPLCANCHAMVHRHNPPMSVDDLRTHLVVQAQSRGAP
jgi:5-methylcytosine-specific restriction protein A